MARHMNNYTRTPPLKATAKPVKLRSLKTDLSLRPSFRKLWKIIGDRIPRRAIGDESMKLRPNSGINIERAHPNRYLRAVRPIAAE